ncbi:MAG: BrnT family toxin [Chloroflexi bacterium]|nr:BrnT family toxin [Chloroflexota bacterium]
MHIERIVCSAHIEDKLAAKHRVTLREVRQVLLGQPRIRFAENGHMPGEDIYAAFGQSYAGRYLAIFFVYKPATETAIVISGRDMTQSERRRYARK